MNYNTRRLFDAIQSIHRDGEGREDGEDRRDTALDNAVAGWSAYDWRDVLLDLPIDSSTFASQLEITWDVSISTLEGWTRRFAAPRDERVLGYAGVLLITLQSLRFSELRRAPWGEVHRGDRHGDCPESCHRLIENTAVQAALAELYAPRMTDSDGLAVIQEWESIDFSTLRFHRHGTTSFIVRGRLTNPAHGRLPTFALKFIIYPFLRMPTISRATRGYAAEFNPPSGDVEYLISVWASSGSWILMDFVEGQTLGERLESEFAAGAAGGSDAKTAIRLDLIEKFGKELFHALASLERLHKQHGDLTPSNIMVVRTPDGQEKLRLIDLGVNYLYLRNMPGHAGVDAPYVAPEIRDIDDQTETGFAKSDLYSLGQLIVLLGSGTPASDGHVPTAFYAQTPSIARFIEDLIDADPRRRLLLFHARHTPDGLPYDRLWTELTDEISAARAGVSGRRWWSDIAALADPFFGTAWRLGRLWRERRKQGATREKSTGRLFAWSVLSAICATLSSVLIGIWIRRTVGWDWDNDVIVALQRLFHARPDEFPIIDQLKVNGYGFPVNSKPHVAFGVLALTYTLVGVKYYQSLFASVTPMVLGRGAGRLGVRAVAAEIGMRFWTIAIVLMVLPPLLVQPLWWAMFGAAGATIVTICNWLAASFGQAVVKEGHRLGMSTVPERISGISLFLSWLPGNVLYAVLLWTIALLLHLRLAEDTIVYVSLISLVNVVQLYVIKCSIQGPDISAGLGRACIAAERIRHLRLAEAAEAAESVGSAEPVVIPRRRGGADPLRSRDESEVAPDRP